MKRWLLNGIVALAVLSSVASVAYATAQRSARAKAFSEAIDANRSAAILIGKALCQQNLVLITLSLEGKSDVQQQRINILAQQYVKPVSDALLKLGAPACVLRRT